MMTAEERDAVLRQVTTVLSDNAGNRITLSLVNGIVATLQAMIPVDPSKQPSDAPTHGQ